MSSVRDAIVALGLDRHALWVDYVTMTGRHSYAEFVRVLDGRRELSAVEYNKLAAALNDHFVGRGLNHPVSYMDDVLDSNRSADAE